MKTKSLIILAALAASLSFAVFTGQIRQRASQHKAESLVRQGLPVGSSRAQVEIWLKSQNVQYAFVPKGKFQDYWLTSSNTNKMSTARKLIVGYLPNSSNLEVFFFFDKQDKLINREVLSSSS